ncbi:MAG TPA: chromate resistance protein ChrB domain-containing protein [Terriglobales bacterium]|nr:chromate resistance protein ChrB domain-containing protein [Terriglobales bacterium]
MAVIHPDIDASWILLMFNLPAKQASQRVEVWRKLKRYGALALESGGHLLPNTPQTLEHFEWLAASIRKFGGQASVLRVHSVDNRPHDDLRRTFVDARSNDYQQLQSELKKMMKSRQQPVSGLGRIRKRFSEISAIDFFNSPARSRLEAMLARAEDLRFPNSKTPRSAQRARKEYLNRTWITRPRPGIDRVSSAWLISHFIDKNARFVFNDDPATHPKAIPFDMFHGGGFGHRGDDCTFETLCKEFQIRDANVQAIAQIVHDADLEDEKFGRSEGAGLDRVLVGWAKQNVSDEELLRRGMQLIDGLYNSQG